jgi:hypothetical protein
MPPLLSASRLRNRTGISSQPPPSSLATHLAPANGSTSSHSHRDDLASLLKESLGSDEEGQPNLGTDVALNHKLACMVIKAGLDTVGLRSDDPFRKDEDQIQGCIEVIDLVVTKTPEALFVLADAEDLGPRAENVPLFFWLIPKLLSLLVLDKGDSNPMEEKVWPLLGKIIASAEYCPNSSDLCLSIPAYFEEMLEGTVNQGLHEMGLIFVKV